MSDTNETLLCILIANKWYSLEQIPFDGERANAKGWKLTRFVDALNHSPYCVIRQPSGRMTCECADFTFVQQKAGGGECKHIRVLKEIGLL